MKKRLEESKFKKPGSVLNREQWTPIFFILVYWYYDPRVEIVVHLYSLFTDIKRYIQ